MFAILFKGWRGFFIGLGIAPLGELAELIGVALVPFMSGWVIAKVLALLLKTVSFKILWPGASTLMFLIMLIGQYRAATGT